MPPTATDAAETAGAGAEAVLEPARTHALGALEVRLVRGEVALSQGGAGRFARARGPRCDVAPRGRLRVLGAGASLVLGAGCELVARGGSELMLAADTAERAAVVTLERGEILVDHAPEGAFELVRVCTEGREYRSHGARFSISAPYPARVLVQKGALERCSASAEGPIEAGTLLALDSSGRATVHRLQSIDAATWAWADALRSREQVVVALAQNPPPPSIEGTTTSGGVLLGEPVPGDTRFAVRAGLRRPSLFRARPGMELRVSCRLEGDGPLVLLARASSGLVFEAPIRWSGREVVHARVALDELRIVGDRRPEPPREGETFSVLELGAGRPGERGRLELRELSVIERR